MNNIIACSSKKYHKLEPLPTINHTVTGAALAASALLKAMSKHTYKDGELELTQVLEQHAEYAFY